MSVIILATCDTGKTAMIVKNKDGTNRTFGSVDEADAWAWDNARELGNCFRIINLGD